MRLIDTHTHLNDEAFSADLDQVIARARGAGVEGILVCGYDLKSSRRAVELAGRFDCLRATVGVHPHDSSEFSYETESELLELSRSPGVIAIGEVGLDFHYDFSPRPKQFSAFEAQIGLAERLELPLVVHSRESEDEVLQVLRHNGQNIRGCVFHCFSGGAHAAQRVLELGYYIGVDGPVTFRNAHTLREVVKMCPLDRLLVETDCPYLTPVPHRGKRNEPAFVRLVVQAVAQIKGISEEQTAEATTANAERLFGPFRY